MTNNFSTLKESNSTEKFFLCRLENRKYITPNFSLLSGTVYAATLDAITFIGSYKTVNIPIIINMLEVDGIELTRSTSDPEIGEYYFNELTRELRVNVDAPILNQYIVVTQYLLFSEGTVRTTSINPLDSSTAKQQWFPRIRTVPSVNYTIKDILQGFFSSGSTSITFDNFDNFFQQFTGKYSSFCNCEATFWICFDDVENVQFAYRGYVKDISLGKQASFSIYDQFSKLSQTLYSNGTELESTFNTTRFPNLNPSNDNYPIRKICAETSYYKVIGDSTESGLYTLDPEYLLDAVNLNYVSAESTLLNRKWGTILGEGDYGIQNDTIQSTDHTNTNYSILGYTAGKKYKIGDTLRVGSAPYYVRIFDVDDSSHLIKTTKEASISSTDTVVRDGISSVVVVNNDIPYYLMCGRDYNISASATNSALEINFVNNFENLHAGLTAINADSSKIRFRAWVDNGKSLLHGDIMQGLLETMGLDVNSTSISSANAVAINTNFYIPYVDDSGFSSAKNFVEDLLASTVGYLSINNDEEIEYHLFDVISPATTINDDYILKDSFNITVDYQDIISSMTPENPHDIIETTYGNSSLEDSLAVFLHKTTLNKKYNHILADTSRMQKVIDILSKRSARYTFETKSKNSDTILGDEFEIERDDLLGSDTTVNIKVLGINKDSRKIKISSNDLLGV